jgi:hypothetical protein
MAVADSGSDHCAVLVLPVESVETYNGHGLGLHQSFFIALSVVRIAAQVSLVRASAAECVSIESNKNRMQSPGGNVSHWNPSE